MIEREQFDIPELTEEDFKKMTKNPFATKFTNEEKFSAFVKAYMKEYGWNKEKLKKEIEVVLA